MSGEGFQKLNEEEEEGFGLISLCREESYSGAGGSHWESNNTHMSGQMCGRCPKALRRRRRRRRRRCWAISLCREEPFCVAFCFLLFAFCFLLLLLLLIGEQYVCICPDKCVKVPKSSKKKKKKTKKKKQVLGDFSL